MRVLTLFTAWNYIYTAFMTLMENSSIRSLRWSMNGRRKHLKSIMKTGTILKFSLCAGLCSAPISCSKQGPTGQGNKIQTAVPRLASLNIADAKSLFIAKKTGAAKRRVVTAADSTADTTITDTTTLFKITNNGYVVEVSYLDSAGDTLRTSVNMPSGLFNVSDTWLTVSFEDNSTYLVRKSDGAAFIGNELPSEANNNFSLAGDAISQDNDGNFYYITGNNSELVKLTVSDPAHLTVTTCSASGDRVESFVGDKAGNLLYAGEDAGDNPVARYRHVTGEFENYSGGYFWTDIDGDSMYYVGSDYRIRKIIPTSPLGSALYGDTTFELKNILGSAYEDKKQTESGLRGKRLYC